VIAPKETRPIIKPTISRNVKATAAVAFCSLSSATGTVSSFRVANRVAESGSFLRGFPMCEFPRLSMQEALSRRHEISLTERRRMGADREDAEFSLLAKHDHLKAQSLQ
jgi:hypothetical protein